MRATKRNQQMVVGKLDLIMEKQAELGAKIDEVIFYNMADPQDKDSARKANETVKRLWPFDDDDHIRTVFNHEPSLQCLKDEIAAILPEKANKHGSFLREVSYILKQISLAYNMAYMFYPFDDWH